ncbi:hypothetical protein TWF481_004066 [Arthrobotrys musiformis]|uniref:Uncharacterized protein n=1 Tax=Arthrobotrys musiformis TaxID=47236 RepID=A0AAV9WIE7_9PEZI
MKGLQLALAGESGKENQGTSLSKFLKRIGGDDVSHKDDGDGNGSLLIGQDPGLRDRAGAAPTGKMGLSAEDEDLAMTMWVMDLRKKNARVWNGTGN